MLVAEGGLEVLGSRVADDRSVHDVHAVEVDPKAGASHTSKGDPLKVHLKKKAGGGTSTPIHGPKHPNGPGSGTGTGTGTGAVPSQACPDGLKPNPVTGKCPGA